MASIGELTATVRADVSGFVGPMQQVVTTTQRTASQVQSITQPTQQLGQSLGQTATAGLGAAKAFETLRAPLGTLAATMAGIPGSIGSIASRLLLFSSGGGVTVAVIAGIAATVAIFKELREETRKQEEAVDDLKASYDEMFGATVRLRREQARQAVADAQRGRLQVIGTGMFGLPQIARITNTEELTTATQALQAAERAYAEHNRSVVEPGMRRAAEAAREAAKAVAEFDAALKNAKGKDTNESTKKVENLTKEAQAWGVVKDAIVAAQRAEDERRANPDRPKVDKETFVGDTQQVVQGARDAAQAMSQAFMTAFTDSKESLTERITSVLRSAVQNAIQRLIEQKLFESFLKAFSPDKGAVSGGVADIAGGVVGGIFGAPPPMATSGGTIIVPLDSLPAPLSPVEVARDAMHQTLWMETARVAEMNGFRLSPRLR